MKIAENPTTSLHALQRHRNFVVESVKIEVKQRTKTQERKEHANVARSLLLAQKIVSEDFVERNVLEFLKELKGLNAYA